MISDATINLEPAAMELDLGPRVKTSALGQKQTCAVHNAMSALPPKADMGRVIRANKDVRAVMVLSDLASGPLKDCRQL